jgi:hypothetical protein
VRDTSFAPIFLASTIASYAAVKEGGTSPYSSRYSILYRFYMVL